MVRAGVIGGAIGLGLVTEDALSESFLYDDKDRLTKADLPATLTDMNIGYTTNNLGNIASKTGQGTYTYSSSKLYALKTIQNTDNTVSSSNQIITYNTFQQPSLITESSNTLSFLYGSDDERRKTTRKYNFSGVNNEVEKRTFLGNYEVLETRACTQLSCTAWTTQQIHYVASGPGYQIIALRTGTTGAFTFYYAYTDYLGSILRVTDANGTLIADGKQSFDAWGRKRNPTTWTYTNIPSTSTWLYRGYTGHETLSQFNLINMNGRLYDPIVGRMLSPDNFVQDATSTQSYNRYSYALNNPLKYRDPDGEFLTWSFYNGGFSIGINGTPAGLPIGTGINIGWQDGFSLGVYGELGPRVGGTGFGSGITASQSFDNNFKNKSWSTTSSVGAYASFGAFNAGGSISFTKDLDSGYWTPSWGVSAGLGFGDDDSGLGFNIGYGSGGFTYGMGGYYYRDAWDSNQTYDPAAWEDSGQLTCNNCWAYVRDEMDGDFINPGEGTEYQIWDKALITLDNMTNASLTNNRVKLPNFWNKLGFGKRGYYSGYLVTADGKDYHFYRQDNGGKWSHKPGEGAVMNVDGYGRIIRNPARANHDYRNIYSYNYNDGGILLWIKK